MLKSGAMELLEDRAERAAFKRGESREIYF